MEMTAAERTNIEDWIRNEQDRLLGFIRKRVDDEEDVRDILQDVYLRLSSGFDDIRAAGSLTSWIFAVARNRITDHYRKKQTESLDQAVVRPGDEGEEPLMLADILPSLGRSPEDESMREVIWEAIQLVLDGLPEKQRDVFLLNEFEELSFKEIAEITGDGVPTLLSRKRYAVAALREQLEPLYKQLNT